MLGLLLLESSLGKFDANFSKNEPRDDIACCYCDFCSSNSFYFNWSITQSNCSPRRSSLTEGGQTGDFYFSMLSRHATKVYFILS